MIEIFFEFLFEFGPFGRPKGDPTTRPGGMRGAWLDSFEFKEFEDYFENESSHAPTLRVAADLIALRAVRRAGL